MLLQLYLALGLAFAAAGRSANPVGLFGEAVNAAEVHYTGWLSIGSATNAQELKRRNFIWQVLGKWSNIQPVGRPQDALSAEKLSEIAV